MNRPRHDHKNTKNTKNTRKPANGTAPSLQAPSDHAAASSGHMQLLLRVMRQVGAGKHDKALELLKSAGQEPQVANARGVCLLRAGRFDEAVRVFRSLVLQPGCTWTRPDIPAVYKVNFATALLLDGHPAGCLEILADIQDQQHPAVVQLRDAIARWERSLSLWQKLNWRWARIEPARRPTLDFEPGGFDIEISPPDAPQPGSSSPSLKTAV